MNADIIEGKWRQFKGDIQAKWGDLTDDQLEEINGNREKFIGKIQENYGVARHEAEKELKEFEKKLAA